MSGAFRTFRSLCIAASLLMFLPSISHALDMVGKKSIYLHDQTGAKTLKNFGAVLLNGIYFKLELGTNGFRGEPEAIDLNLITAPPDRLDMPPCGAGERNSIEKGARCFTHLIIE